VTKPPGLDRLLSTSEVRTFRRARWPDRWAYFRGDGRRLGTLAAFSRLHDVREWSAARPIRYKAADLRGAAYAERRLELAAAKRQYRAGVTIAMNGMERTMPYLDAWTRALAREVGADPDASGCNIYVSPSGVGLPRHFDDHPVIVVQIHGRKRWHVAANPHLAHPTANCVAAMGLPPAVKRYAAPGALAEQPTTTVEMRPGSVLFLPAGTWHATEADGTSISLTFGLRARRYFELALAELADELVLDPALRAYAWSTRGAPSLASVRPALTRALARVERAGRRP
jgi:hypothetical protein